MIAPDSRSTVSGPPGLSHAGWQRSHWSNNTRRLLRLAVGVTVLLVLGALFTQAVLLPLTQPRVHVFVLSGVIPVDVGAEELPALRPAAKGSELLPLVRGWTARARLSEPKEIAGLASGQTLEELIQWGHAAGIHAHDVVIGVVQTQLIAKDDGLALADRLQPDQSPSGRIALDRFIAALRAIPARTRLLCLDAGQIASDPRSGLFRNEFDEQLRQIVEGTGDPGLWVLVSHRAGDESPASLQGASTVFLNAVARGLLVAGQRDGDRRTSLGELVAFVQEETANGLSRSDPVLRSPTVWLLRGGGTWTDNDLNVVVAPVPDPTAERTVGSPGGARETVPLRTQPSADSPSALAITGAPEAHTTANTPSAWPTSTGNPSPTAAETAAAAGSPTSATSAGTAASAAASANVPGLKPVTAMTVAELLSEAWDRRDALEQWPALTVSRLPLRPRDYAPWRWNRLVGELVAADSLWRNQPELYPQQIQAQLRRQVHDLRELALGTNTSRSTWRAAVLALQPRPQAALFSASLPIGEAWSVWSEGRVGDREAGERAALQSILTATDGQPLQNWLASKPTIRSTELLFAARLANTSGMDWSQIQSAFKTRCLAESVACRPLAIRWFQAELSRADQLRWSGERQLVRPVRAMDGQVAQRVLREAGTLYELIASSTERLEAATRLERELLALLPAWMSLARHPGLDVADSLREELSPLLTDLEDLIVLLVNERSEDLGRVEQLRNTLEQRHERIREWLFPSDVFGGLAAVEPFTPRQTVLARALLDTPLPTARQRQILHAGLTRQKQLPAALPATVVGRTLVQARPAAPAMSDVLSAPVRVASGQTRPERDISRGPSLNFESRYIRLLQPLQRLPGEIPGKTGRWVFPATAANTHPAATHADQAEGLEAQATAVTTAQVTFPGRLRKALTEADLIDRTTARAWRHAVPLVDPRDELPLAIEQQFSTLLLDDMERVIQWQWDRSVRARSDATAEEVVELQEQLDQFSTVLTTAFGARRATIARDPISIRCQDSVDLATTSDGLVSLVVSNLRPATVEVRYLVEFDSSVLVVEAADAPHCRLLDRPFSSDLEMAREVALGPGRNIPPNGQEELRLRVRGRQSEAPARMVVHVCAGPSTFRRDVTVKLPPPPLAAVVVTTPTNARWAVTAQQLRPLPNRATAYGLLVQSLRSDTNSLAVTAHRVTSAQRSWPATPTVPAAMWERWLSQSPGVEELAHIPSVNVSRDDPVPLRFPAVKADPSSPLDVSGGIVLAFRDPQRQLVTWQHLACTPLRPAAFLEVLAERNPERDGVKVVVRPRDGLDVPAEGIAVRCRIVKPADREASAGIRWESTAVFCGAGVLQPHQPSWTLTIPRSEPAEPAVLLVDVDDWPRAFVFAIDGDGVRPSETFAIEILEPQRRSAVRAPVAMVPLRVAVTCPQRFQTGDNLWEAGIDRNGDRRLDGEPTVRLSSDRQSRVVIDAIDAGGMWTLTTQVSDWSLSVPTAGLSSQWGTALARIINSPQDCWSDGVAIAFDRDGPQLSQIEVRDAGVPVVGRPVQITLRADDVGLSGVAGVTAGVDPNGVGVLGPKSVMVAGQVEDGDRWLVTVPTDKLAPGAYAVVLQATDFVGNAGPLRVVPLRCLSVEEAAAAQRVTLQGVVQYGGGPLSEVEVRMTAVSGASPVAALPTITGHAPAAPPANASKPQSTRSNGRGEFRFADVAPGLYELTATATLSGFQHEGRARVTVEPGKGPPPLQLALRPKSRP